MLKEYSPAQLLNFPPFDPEEWVIDRLIRVNRTRPSLICGFPESGKSTFACQMALAVANGVPFLGRDAKKGKVIFWKSEDSAEDIGADFARAGMTLNSNIKIVNKVSPEPGEPEDDNNTDILKKLKEHPDTRLVIIETLMDFFDIEDINSNSDCKKAIKAFNDLVVKTNPKTAFVILHQFNKSNLDGKALSITKILGGTILPSATDTKLCLSQVSDTDSRRILITSVRAGGFKKIEPTYLVFDEETMTSTLGETVREEAVNKQQTAKVAIDLDLDTRIVGYVNNNPGTPKMQVVAAMGGNAETTKKRIDQLLAEGFITFVMGGRKGNAQLLYTAGKKFANIPFAEVKETSYGHA